jgi:hypothetical protein
MAMSKRKDNSIEAISTVEDRGTRGKPRAGCDCMQCFGYCMLDRDKFFREVFSAKEDRRKLSRESAFFAQSLADHAAELQEVGRVEPETFE